LTTTWAPGTDGNCSDSLGRTRSSSVLPSRSASRAAARTDVSAQTPPTKPSMDPSARITASSPGTAEVGACARTTVACTNGRR